MRCCRCREELDTDVPAVDFRTGGLVCVRCHDEEREVNAPKYAIRMAEVPNGENWE